MNYSYNIKKPNNIILYGIVISTICGLNLILYIYQHQKIINFLEKKTAPYVSDYIYSYVFGEKFIKLKNNIIKKDISNSFKKFSGYSDR